uniref:Uncharacterized protein n=1 Tax=Rhizophora mucronata TaxID=61149 RepID=A0A2P2NNZ5_RHIMU
MSYEKAEVEEGADTEENVMLHCGSTELQNELHFLLGSLVETQS